MKTVLTISYHYPPIASPGSERARAFIRHLPNLGYRLDVVTTSTYGGFDDVLRVGEPVGLFRSAFNPDSHTAAEHVRSRVRTDAGIATSTARWLKDAILIPDAQVAWCAFALLPALRHLFRTNASLIYTSSPPHSVHLLGMALKAVTRLPWVAEFRDLWSYDVLDPAADRPLRRSLEHGWEQAVAIHADRLVAVTGRSAERLSTLTGASKVRCVTNGFDEDASDAEISSDCEGPLRLVHTGGFAESHPLRSPEALVQAAASLGSQAALSLVGALTKNEEEVVEKRGGARVEAVGVVARDEALRRQREADVLVLVDHARPFPSTNVPSKCYEYLATGKPILALTGEGAVRDLIEETRGGVYVDPEDEQAIRGAIQELAQAKKSASLVELGASRDAIGCYERGATAKVLAEVFDEVSR